MFRKSHRTYSNSLSFEMPQALVDEFGGWKNRRCIDAFVEYARICFTKWKGIVNYWVTINEQLIAMAASDLMVIMKVIKYYKQKICIKCLIMLLWQKKSYEIIKRN